MGLSCTINVKIDEAGALILMLLVAMMADDSENLSFIVTINIISIYIHLKHTSANDLLSHSKILTYTLKSLVFLVSKHTYMTISTTSSHLKHIWMKSKTIDRP